MTTAETLRALLALVEEAKAGSRELDIELWALHGDCRVRNVEGKLAYYETVKDGFWIRSIKPLRSLVPFYTTSIDAALALVAKVLPGWRWVAHSPRSGLQFGVSLSDPARGGWIVPAEHKASAPMSIIAALLKAKVRLVEKAEAGDE